MSDPSKYYYEGVETETMAGSSTILGGGRCVKADGYVITLFRRGPHGSPILKVKKLKDR